MSTVADAVAVTTPTGRLRLAGKIAIKLAPWVAVAVLAAALLLTRSTLERVKLEHKAAAAEQGRAAAERYAANAGRLAAAADSYATRQAALQPLIVRSTDTVRSYAETPAGRVLCRDPDRVRGIDELDASLRASVAAGEGEGAVRPDAPAPPAGR